MTRPKEKSEFIAQFAELLRAAHRSGVANLTLDNENTARIHWETGGSRIVDIEADSDAAIILDVIRKVLY